MNNDVIYYIFTFLIKKEKCKIKIKMNLKLISKSINKFFKMNNCKYFNKYNDKVWCNIHNHYEYKLAKLIYTNKINNTDTIFNNIFSNMDSNSLTLHLKYEDYDKYNLKQVYDKVTNNDCKCQFSHLCCSNSGIVFNIK